MKRSSIFSVAAIALIATSIPFLDNTPVLAGFQEVGEAIAQAIKGPDVKLNLIVAKKLVTKDAEGKEKITWEELKNNAVVMPGDSLRYQVSSENMGDRAAEDLVITQPIPPKTIYELSSASSNNNAEITYSIDNGKTYVEQPMVEVTLPDGKVEKRPAPAEAYTHIKWKVSKAIDPKVRLTAMYDVKVR
jgi:uncharacterized repeat protein (TIGR01451 family)